MFRVFISQPMRGKSADEIQAERDTVELTLRTQVLDHDFVVIPMLPERDVKYNSPVYCLGRSIQDISMADLVVFAEGWEDARGCRIEHTVCSEYGTEMIHMAETAMQPAPDLDGDA